MKNTLHLSALNLHLLLTAGDKGSPQFPVNPFIIIMRTLIPIELSCPGLSDIKIRPSFLVKRSASMSLIITGSIPSLSLRSDNSFLLASQSSLPYSMQDSVTGRLLTFTCIGLSPIRLTKLCLALHKLFYSLFFNRLSHPGRI